MRPARSLLVMILGLAVPLALAPAAAQTAAPGTVGGSAPGAAAEEAPVETPWQDAITGQLDAFRAGDGAGALVFAGSSFKAAYADPNMFYEGILRAGYEALVTSRSHTFGTFEQVGDTLVLQIVDLVGPDQRLYRAVYQMVEEPDGWRVTGVAMQQQEGLGV